MKAYGVLDLQIHIFVTSALVGSEWSASRPSRITPGERISVTNWIWGWVGPRTGLHDVENRKYFTLPGLELRPLSCSASSQSLYRLSYPGCFARKECTLEGNLIDAYLRTGKFSLSNSAVPASLTPGVGVASCSRGMSRYGAHNTGVGNPQTPHCWGRSFPLKAGWTHVPL
jgi:hypothetical protein